MGRSRVLALAALASLGLAACGGGSGSSGGTSNKPDKVQIAAEGPFTGDEASIGAGALQAIQLAVKDFNAAGGVNGTQVNLLVWDDQHSPQTAATLQAQGISDPTVLGIVGPMNSGVVLGTIQGLQGASPPLPFVSESASNTKITDSGDSVAHRVNARDDAQGPADGKFLVEKKATKVEIMDAKSDYSTALADQVASYLKTNASTVQVQRDSATHGQTDFSTIVQKIKSFGADWVYFADEGPEVAPLVQQLKAQGMVIGQNINFLGSDGTQDPSIIGASQGAYLNAYATNVTASPIGVSTAASFVSNFKATYGADSISKAGPFVGSAYEAAQVLLQAIKSSPVNNGKISRNDVISHLGSDTFSTIFGSVKFDSKGDVAGGGIYVYQAKGTDMVVVEKIST
ncbi:MAG TPA: branched-chain amino acid ABC transporter substrate-binding protein [Candidatus Limnocylindrales bacterium]|nr:branched-chain amino acid ABC transporter substrate-binding protein [Candidatus Limnocylindrales bacterium]